MWLSLYIWPSPLIEISSVISKVSYMVPEPWIRAGIRANQIFFNPPTIQSLSGRRRGCLPQAAVAVCRSAPSARPFTTRATVAAPYLRARPPATFAPVRGAPVKSRGRPPAKSARSARSSASSAHSSTSHIVRSPPDRTAEETEDETEDFCFCNGGD